MIKRDLADGLRVLREKIRAVENGGMFDSDNYVSVSPEAFADWLADLDGFIDQLEA